MSRIFALIALCLSKVSVLVFTRQIFSGNIRNEKLCFAIAYSIISIYGVGAVLLTSAGCNPKKSLIPEMDAVCHSNVSIQSLQRYNLIG